MQVINIIVSHPDNDIVIGIDSLGKEDLLLHIARVLKIKVCVHNCNRNYMLLSHKMSSCNREGNNLLVAKGFWGLPCSHCFLCLASCNVGYLIMHTVSILFFTYEVLLVCGKIKFLPVSCCSPTHKDVCYCNQVIVCYANYTDFLFSSSKIWVWPERLQTMHLLGYDEIFTTKTSLTRVRAVPRYSFSVETLEGLNTMRPTIGIMPSGLPWVVKPSEGNDNLFGSLLTSRYKKSRCAESGWFQTDKSNGSLGSIKRFHKYIYSVSYSDHSSYLEIEKFIKLVQPGNMKGIVSSSTCYVDPVYYFGRLCAVNQPVQNLRQKHKRKERDEMSLANKSSFSGSISTELARKLVRNMTVKFVRTQASRVSACRRVRCGAKILEDDYSD